MATITSRLATGTISIIICEPSLAVEIFQDLDLGMDPCFEGYVLIMAFHKLPCF
jgi:hypothetical protein